MEILMKNTGSPDKSILLLIAEELFKRSNDKESNIVMNDESNLFEN